MIPPQSATTAPAPAQEDPADTARRRVVEQARAAAGALTAASAQHIHNHPVQLLDLVPRNTALCGRAGVVESYNASCAVYDVRVTMAMATSASCLVRNVPAACIRPLSSSTARLIEAHAGDVYSWLLDAAPSPREAGGPPSMTELRILSTARRFFHLFARTDSGTAFVMAALANATGAPQSGAPVPDAPEGLPASYVLWADDAFSVGASSPWAVRLVRPAGADARTLALYDGSDDVYGELTGLPRRELGLIRHGLPTAAASGSVSWECAIPRVRRSGATAQLLPANANETIAALLARGDTTHLTVLSGTVSAVDGGRAEAYAHEGGVRVKVFEACKRADSDWHVAYAPPLTPVQAFALAISLQHSAEAARLHTLAPAASLPSADQQASEMRSMAAEALEALRRGGGLTDAHERLHVPYAALRMQSLIDAALARADHVPADGFATVLANLLGRVGLRGEGRPERTMEWASENGVGSLSAMYALLQVQPSGWKGLLQALAPTKAYHKMRIANQLKAYATDGTPPALLRAPSEVYWSLIHDADEVGEPLPDHGYDGGGTSEGGSSSRDYSSCSGGSSGRNGSSSSSNGGSGGGGGCGGSGGGAVSSSGCSSGASSSASSARAEVAGAAPSSRSHHDICVACLTPTKARVARTGTASTQHHSRQMPRMRLASSIVLPSSSPPRRAPVTADGIVVHRTR